MKRHNLGELEELVLLTVSTLHPEAYGVSVRHEIYRQAARNITLSTVHVALHRLEEKGFVKSQFGEASNVRGGKRKRIFKITALGLRVLQEIREVRQKLWNSIPEVIFQKR